jgi:hypothetical protein
MEGPLLPGDPHAVIQYDDEAATTIAQDHLAIAYSLQAESGDIEDFALSLRETGYIRLSDFRRAVVAYRASVEVREFLAMPTE